MTDFDAAGYLAARASAARSLRETHRLAGEEDGPGWRLLAATSGMLAESLECWSPFAGRGIVAFDLVPPPALASSGAPRGCYAASFGMVHVKPGCRCGGWR